MRLKISKKRGFTLVEVLLAVIVMGASLMGILMLFSKGTMFISQVQANDLVVDLLEEEMELVRREGFSTILTMPGAFTLPEFSQLINATGSLNVDSPPGIFVPNNRIVRVTVTINWDSPSGQSLTRSLVTYIVDQGISS